MATSADLKLSLSQAKRGTGVIDKGVVVSFLTELKSGIPALLKVSPAEADVLQKVIDMKVLFQLSGLYIKDDTVVELDGGKRRICFHADSPDEWYRDASDQLENLCETILQLLSADMKAGQQSASGSKRKRAGSAAAQSGQRECLDQLLRPANDRSLLSLFEYRKGSATPQHCDRGLLTIVFSPPADGSLLDKDGTPVVTGENELIVMAGGAMERATAGACIAASHAVQKVATPRVSLVYSARGCGSATLDPARFCLPVEEGGKAAQRVTLDEFYSQWEATHSSINAPATGSSSSSSSSSSSLSVALSLKSEPFSLKIRSSVGEILFRVCSDTRFEKIFVAYANQKGVRVTSFDFIFNGQRVQPLSTPATLEMVDGAVVYASSSAPVSLKSVPLILKIRSSDGDRTSVRVLSDTRFDKIYQAYANLKGIDAASLRLLFDGQRMLDTDTPAMFQMVDGELIDAIMQTLGD